MPGFAENSNYAHPFELTVAKNASGSITWPTVFDKTFENENTLKALDNVNVTLDPSAVHLRFGDDSATAYTMYTDTVLLVYRSRTNDAVRYVDRHEMNLSEVTVSECGMLQFLRAEFSDFYALWHARYKADMDAHWASWGK
jgi:hypothetical protein